MSAVEPAAHAAQPRLGDLVHLRGRHARHDRPALAACGPSTTAQHTGLAHLGLIAGAQAATTVMPALGSEPEGRGRLASAVISGTMAGAVLALGVHRTAGGWGFHASAYGIAVMAFFGAKLALSYLAPPLSAAPVPGVSVAVVITCYNEDPVAFGRCLDSLLAQTRLPDAVAVIDDCSADLACHDLARRRAIELQVRGCAVTVIRQPVNRGKREGLAEGFAAFPQAGVYLCVDSDTVLDRRAIARGLGAFADPRVMAATGTVLAANRDRNVLTRLIDLRYAYAFLGERAAYSAFGSVLCVCGSLAFYRGDRVRALVGEFLGQQFLGIPSTYGDDRHWTNLLLREGRVVMVPSAVAWTLVPERMGHFLRQQARWSRSFARESLWSLRNLSPRRPAWWLTLTEVATQAGFTCGLLYALAVHPLLAGRVIPGTYLLAALFLAWARAGHYAEADHPGMTLAGRILGFALAPAYSVLSMLILMPIRIYALCTLKDGNWGTRQRVEVTAS